MGQFFKFLLASCLGILISVFLLFAIGGIFVTAMVNKADKAVAIRPNTVLHLTFENPIPEQTNNLDINPFDLSQKKTLGLQEILESIQAAKEDDDIKGILLEPEAMAGSGLATASVLREALLDFKTSGKFILAYSKYYSQGGYYLASVADEILVFPMGLVDFRGFSAQIPFFKDMLDKVGIEMQVFYAGKFKGASEPLRLNKMSDENRLQIREYLEDVYAIFLEDIAASRPLSTAQLRQLADEYVGMDPVAAAEAGLVDRVAHRDEALAALRSRLGLEEDDKIPSVSLADYRQARPGKKNFKVKEKIAIIYAEGNIVDGDGQPGSIGDKKYAKHIAALRKDKNVKAIVLRVNSPGGSALASENIWRELSLTKAAGKPVVVSMGDYAASGGYYIAALADSIFAEPNTLTGSIGVFNAFPNVSTLLEKKIGIHFDTVKTSVFSTAFQPFYPLSPAENQVLQNRLDQTYETFLQRVSEGRQMSKDSVMEIAQGRIWTGKRAVEIGLVDRLAGMDEALAAAASLAGTEEYRTTHFPAVKDPLQQLIEEVMGGSSSDVRARAMMRSQLGSYYPYYRFLQELQTSQGLQARLPIMLPLQ
jgi:protease IV